MECLKYFTLRKMGFLFLLLVMRTSPLFAYEKISVKTVTATPAFPPAMHHGVTITIDPIADMNLSGFEVYVKPANGPSSIPWQFYSAQIFPTHGTNLNLPFRNEHFAFQSGQSYCLRIRARYGSQLSPWSESCGFTPTFTPSGTPADQDGDKKTDDDEYALGLDPLNPDTDGDGISDGQEVAQGTNPLQDQTPNIVKLSDGVIDFGFGDPTGSQVNQHHHALVQATADEKVFFQNVQIVDNPEQPGGSGYFHAGKIPEGLTPIPPANQWPIPISFIPAKRGPVSALLQIGANSVNPIPPTLLKGYGIGIPDCQITPQELDFGTVAQNDQAVAMQEILFANKPPAGDTTPPNLDTPWRFTLMTELADFAPGTRVMTLKPGEQIKIPLFFRHTHPGKFSGQLIVHSHGCGNQVVKIKGEVLP